MVVLLWGLWCGGCYGVVILQVDFAVVISMVFAMVLQVFVMGATVVGWLGLDGGCLGFWVCSQR